MLDVHLDSRCGKTGTYAHRRKVKATGGRAIGGYGHIDRAQAGYRIGVFDLEGKLVVAEIAGFGNVLEGVVGQEGGNAMSAIGDDFISQRQVIRIAGFHLTVIDFVLLHRDGKIDIS